MPITRIMRMGSTMVNSTSAAPPSAQASPRTPCTAARSGEPISVVLWDILDFIAMGYLRGASATEARTAGGNPVSETPPPLPVVHDKDGGGARKHHFATAP